MLEVKHDGVTFNAKSCLRVLARASDAAAEEVRKVAPEHLSAVWTLEKGVATPRGDDPPPMLVQPKSKSPSSLDAALMRSELNR